MRAGTVPILALGLLALTAAAAAAQNRVQIEGTVLDESTGRPIPGVNITVRNTNDQYLRQATSDDVGRFSIMVYRTSAVRIFAARIGYRRTATPVLHFDGNQFFQVELRMDPEALLLAPLEVVARSATAGSPVLVGFRERVGSGLGHYITRTDIEQQRPVFVSDMLQHVPGIRLSSSGRGSRRIVHMARSEALDCQVQLFVDGRLMTRGGGTFGDFSIDDFVEPESVEGIEVYRGLSTMPPEFYTPDAKCGVVAVWTRRGDR